MKSKFTCLFLLFAAPLLYAQATPSLMSYQGRVTDAAGVLIGNTTPTNRTVTFKLYSASSGGTALYAELQTVTISGGEFSVLIGNGTGVTGSFGPSSPATTPYKTIGDIINSGTYSSLYLGVTVDDGTAAVDPEVSPRQQMVSGAFALRSKVAETVASGAVSTSMIGDASVTTSKIAASAIDSSRIADSTIVAADIASSAITATKIDTSTIGVWTPVGSSVYRTNNVGIGEANPGFPLNFGSVYGDKISLWGNAGATYGFGIQSNLLQIHSDTTSSDVAIGSGSSASFTETMRVKGNGNVGIGYNNPGQKLDVNGVGRFGHDCAKIGVVDVGFYGDNTNIALRTSTNGATYFQSASGANTWMYIANGGNIGIGTTNPAVLLDVYGNNFLTMTDNGFANTAIFNSGVTHYSKDTFSGDRGIENYGMDGSQNLNGGWSLSAQTSIRATGYIVSARGFAAYSDRRIKRDAKASATAKDLAAIEKLKVTDYRMVDPEGWDVGWHKGFIAQEVAEVLPGAVTKSVNFVPDIFAVADKLAYDADKKTLRVSLSKGHKLIAGERVRLHADGKRLDLTVSAVISTHKFEVEQCEAAPEKVFVYGREVSDFNTLDYNRIYTTSVGAIQELASKVEADDAEITALKSSQIALETRLSALEKLIQTNK